jgi:hypothetical protein
LADRLSENSQTNRRRNQSDSQRESNSSRKSHDDLINSRNDEESNINEESNEDQSITSDSNNRYEYDTTQFPTPTGSNPDGQTSITGGGAAAEAGLVGCEIGIHE